MSEACVLRSEATEVENIELPNVPTNERAQMMVLAGLTVCCATMPPAAAGLGPMGAPGDETARDLAVSE